MKQEPRRAVISHGPSLTSGGEPGSLVRLQFPSAHQYGAGVESRRVEIAGPAAGLGDALDVAPRCQRFQRARLSGSSNNDDLLPDMFE